MPLRHGAMTDVVGGNIAEMEVSVIFAAAAIGHRRSTLITEKSQWRDCQSNSTRIIEILGLFVADMAGESKAE